MTAPEGTRWLTPAEMAAWLPLVRLMTLLPQRLDRQLREDAGIGHVYYQILAMLSEAPGQQLRMSELAGLTATSPSRLSHAVSALEDRGWVVRCPSERDGRGQVTRLTPAGRAAVEGFAPGHVAEVRRLVVDRLAPEEVDQLARIAGKLLDAATDRRG
ncbi:MarR family winged helix-turn-helix transcriptional regulator [Geodermatophilus sp. SYSU D00691]